MEYRLKYKAPDYFTKSHELVRKTVREFVKKEVLPYVNEWEEAGSFPKEIYKKKQGSWGY